MGKPDRRAALGHAGEHQAAEWYRAHGYAVLERNWRCGLGELDLICARGRTLVVCEVKSRTRTVHGHPLEAVTPAKRRRLRRLAVAYLRSKPGPWAEVRFDVASLLGATLSVVEDAF
jgi:putative endonuclease